MNYQYLFASTSTLTDGLYCYAGVDPVTMTVTDIIVSTASDITLLQPGPHPQNSATVYYPSPLPGTPGAAGIGLTRDSVNQVYYTWPAPYPSWQISSSTYWTWVPPVAAPDPFDTEVDGSAVWDEELGTWRDIDEDTADTLVIYITNTLTNVSTGNSTSTVLGVTYL